jgi:hypothetical protein
VDAAILINTPLDGVVNCYRSFVVLGLLAVVWGVFLARGLLLGHGDLVQHCGGAALVMWGAAGVFRGVLRWRRFARR